MKQICLQKRLINIYFYSNVIANQKKGQEVVCITMNTATEQ